MFLIIYFFQYFDFTNYYLLGIGIITLFFFFLLNVLKRSANRDSFSEILFKLCDYEERFDMLMHDISNSLTVVFFENQDKSLHPYLDKIKLSLNARSEGRKFEECSVGGIIVSSVRKLGYYWNINLEKDCKVFGHYCELALCLCYIVDYCTKFGSTIEIKEKSVSFVLKDTTDVKRLKKVLNILCGCKVLIQKNLLYIKWKS